MTELYDRLKQYAETDWYPWHMPGHKRQMVEFVNPFSIDITEIDGFDDLHHPEGILKDAMEYADIRIGKNMVSDQWFFLRHSCGNFRCRKAWRQDSDGKKLPQICLAWSPSSAE